MQIMQLKELTIPETDVIYAWQAEPCRDLGTALVCAAPHPHLGFLSEETDVREAARIMQREHRGGKVMAQQQPSSGMERRRGKWIS
jgi:hypothetical protein